MASLHTAGCIIPQEDNFLDPLPPARNRPPRIILSQLSPPEVLFKMHNGTGCEDTTYTFSAAVEDPDVNDPIYVSFWVDYRPGEITPLIQAEPPVLPSSGTPQRGVKAEVTFDARQQALGIFQVGTHTLDMIVSDEPLGSGRQPLGRAGQAADGGEAPGYSDSFTWFVDTVTGCPTP